jgi:hypothetical protein
VGPICNCMDILDMSLSVWGVLLGAPGEQKRTEFGGKMELPSELPLCYIKSCGNFRGPPVDSCDHMTCWHWCHHSSAPICREFVVLYLILFLTIAFSVLFPGVLVIP